MIVKKLVVMGKKKDQAHYLKVGEIFAGSLPQQEGQKSKCSCILMHLSGGGGVGGGVAALAGAAVSHSKVAGIYWAPEHGRVSRGC